MSKKKLEEILKAAAEEKDNVADLSATVVKQPLEKRDTRLTGYVRPSEKEDFLKLIGRTSESDAVRELVIRFIAEGKELS